MKFGGLGNQRDSRFTSWRLGVCDPRSHAHLIRFTVRVASLHGLHSGEEH